MKDKYLYPAVFHVDETGVSVAFPDLPGCHTCGKTPEGAMSSAREALSLHLYGLEQDGDPIPEPSPVGSLDAGKGGFVGMIETWMIPFRMRMANRAVKKTLTIPKWLDDLAAQSHVNFSQVLQDALKTHLGLDGALQQHLSDVHYPSRGSAEYVRDSPTKAGRPAGAARGRHRST